MTILPLSKAGKITLLICSLLDAEKHKNSENESILFTFPDTKIFLISSPTTVPPGSLVVIKGNLKSSSKFDNNFI